MEKENTMKNIPREKRKINLRDKTWVSVTIISIVVMSVIIGTYCYFKPPKFSYPKAMNTYKISAKNNKSDIVVNKLLYSIYKNEVDVCREILGVQFFNDYGVDYYSGVFDDDKVRYLLTRANEDLTKEYGEGWYDNLVVQGIENKEIDNLVHSTVNILHNGKEFTFGNKAIGFNDKYGPNTKDIKKVFDTYMLDDSRRPKSPYKK
ncbi:hypothetical protein [Clostridium hydrogeniformans]|uniref:hypothetical protein n=1 Tax=Clostridium hydrogeniformans TaxID=349933 RepID=UPI00048530A5|nr:hypothetical protein [Clostridium hydrogeniformans]